MEYYLDLSRDPAFQKLQANRNILLENRQKIWAYFTEEVQIASGTWDIAPYYIPGKWKWKTYCGVTTYLPKLKFFWKKIIIF